MTENNRLDEKDPDSVLFNMILNNIRDREIIEEKWSVICENFSMLYMKPQVFKDLGFEDDGICRLFFTNKEFKTIMTWKF